MEPRTLGLTALLLFTSLSAVTWATVDHLTLHDCMQNKTREYGRLVSLTLDPYPPQLPGKVTVSATVQLDKSVGGHVRMDLQIVKKLGFLGYALQIPCIGNVGTCNYTDVCAMLRGETPTKPPTTTTATTATMARTVATLASCEGCSQSETVLTQVQDLFSTETSTISTSSAESEASETTIQESVTTPSSSGVETLATPGTERVIDVDSVQTTAVGVTDAEADEVDVLPSDGVPVVDENGNQVTSQPFDAEATDVTTEATSSLNTTPDGSLVTAQPSEATSSLTTTPDGSLVTAQSSEATSSLTTTPDGSLVTAQPSVTVDESTSGSAMEIDATTQRPCPDIMVKNNLPCACPFKPGSYTLPPTSFDIPDLGLLSSLARGDYRIRVRFFDMDTGEMLACQQMETTISDPCSGMDCIVG